MLTKRQLLACVLLGTASVGLALVRCGGDDGTPADAGVGEKYRPDVSAVDAGDAAVGFDAEDAQCVPDGALAHDFSGYTRLATLDPCCRVDVPDDLGTVPSMAWVACTSGRANCSEFAVSWTNADGPRRFAYARRYGQVPQNAALEVSIWRGSAEFEDIVYALADGTKLKSWRSDQTSGCFVNSATNDAVIFPIGVVRSDPFRVGLEARDSGPMLSSVYQAIPSSIISASTESVQSVAMSNTVVAMAASPLGAIVLGPPAGPFVRSKPSAQQVNRPFVFGDLVLAHAAKGNQGFGQVDKVALDGTISPFISKSSVHVSGATSDGQRIYWVEGSGSPNPNVQPTACEVWSAPFTDDASTLATNASKLATLTACGLAASSIAYGGYLAILIGGQMTVIRVSDGLAKPIVDSPGRTFGPPVNVTDTELWATENGPKDAVGMALVRVQYPAW